MPAEGRIPAEVRRALVGLDGPAVTVSAAVAYWVAPVLRAWVTAQREAGRPVPEQVALELRALEVAGDWYRAGLVARSDSGPVGGPALPPSPAMPVELTTCEAARELGVGERQVCRLIDRRRLRARRVGRSWLVDAASVAEHRRRKGAA